MASQHLRRPVWGHVVFVFAVAGFLVWYFLDAYKASSQAENLMLIAPATAIGLATALFIVLTEFVERKSDDAEDRPPPIDWRIPAFMVAVGLYVAGLAYIGFDVATFLFLIVALRLLGERNRILLIVYALFVTGLSVLGMQELLSVPVPTVFFDDI